VSPDYLAKENNRQFEAQPVIILAKFGSAATNEVTRRTADPIDFDVFDDETSGAAAEIATVYRRKLAGLRYLPRSERPHALRAAREWRRSALRAIREKRATERYARRKLRPLLMPELR
jgi:hypothetical protein